jgi:hypothetical protein
LLEARDAYHVFLMRKPNVVGTAIGRFRIRKDGVNPRAAKTLENTEVRSYSWPCILVFVFDWLSPDALGKKGKPASEDHLPSQLHPARPPPGRDRDGRDAEDWLN